MPLSIGIVGLPNVGKSTLFNALTKNKAEASNYPFCTIEPNQGVVEVPDDRLLRLAEISKPKKIVPTIIEFVDIAGLVRGAHKGEGLGNQFLSHIRECDAICMVVREFKDGNIIHVHNKIDPEDDRSTINLELIFADLQSIDRKIEKLTKEAKSGNKELIKQKELLEKAKNWLENEKPLRDIEFNDEEKKFLKQFNFLTAKPILYLLNTDKEGESNFKWDGEILCLNARLEEEIAQLGEEEKKEYIKELGLDKSGLDKLIQKSYKLLDIISFFTTGPDETRAWTVNAGASAPQAAGKIHTDFEKGFVRAEIINWKDFVDVGGEIKAKEKGLIRTEGKDYIMKDGDVCHFLFNR